MTTLRQQQATNVVGAVMADRRLYVTADRSRVVEEGDLEAAFLLVGSGGTITAAQVQQYGLRQQVDGRLVLPSAVVPDEPAGKSKGGRRSKAAEGAGGDE